MGRTVAKLGKFTPPDTSGLLNRERLFHRLDEARRGTLAWVTAPAGAGKTSLLASWLSSRGLPAIWHQIDEGDNDLATFFHSLTFAAGSRRRLPRLSPEHLMAPEAFTRNFVQRLFQSWTQPHALVFDNADKLEEDAGVWSVIGTAIDLLPRGSLVLVVSREDAGKALATRFAYGNTTRIGWDELRFTPQESEDLARLWKVRIPDLAGLHAVCDGWPAIQVLMMRLGREISIPAGLDQPNAVAQFLEAELIGQLSSDQRRFLSAVAVPPFISARLARQMTGRADAEDILSRFSHQHLLISSTGGIGLEEKSYQLHPILREFLLSRLEIEYPGSEAAVLRSHTAHVLASSGLVEAAADLLVDAHAWPALAELVGSHAASLMEAGRVAPVRRWLESLPESARATNPWLLYWYGSVLRMFDPLAARHALEQAYGLFSSANDADGAYLAWAGVVETFAAPWDDFGPVEGWLDELQKLRERYPVVVNPEVELSVLHAGVTTVVGAPLHPMASDFVTEARALVSELPTSRHVGPLVWPIALTAAWRGDEIGETKALLSRIAFSQSQRDAHPLAFILFALANAYLDASDLDPDGARVWVARGREAADRSGVHVLDFLLGTGEAYAATINGNLAAAQVAFNRVEQTLNPAFRLDVDHLRYLRAGIQLMHGDASATLRALSGLADSVKRSHATGPMMFERLLFAQALALDGQGAPARALLAALRDFAERFPSVMTEFQVELIEAYSWYREGETDRELSALRRAMRIGSAANCLGTHPFWLPAMLTPLCQHAMDSGIETTYVSRLIRRRHLCPASPATENWPWPIRILTLGRFEVIKDNQPLRVPGKAQKKPLELLRFLVAAGGREVPIARIADALWPDSDGDAARNAADATVLRLRRLLGRDDVVEVHEGCLTLSDAVCSVDVWALEHLTSAPDAEIAITPDLANRILDLYGGDFLVDGDAQWAVVPRERLRARMRRAVMRAADAARVAGDRDNAEHLLERLLERDPLAEEAYRRLMSLHAGAGRVNDAIRVYERCRAVFAALRNWTPSVETLRLRESLLD